MKKLLIIVLAILVLLGIILAVFFSMQKTNPAPMGNNPSFPNSGTATSSGTASGQKLQLTNANGQQINTNNFLKDSATAADPVNNGYYYIGYNSLSGQTDMPYQIEYIDQTQFFNIELLQEPLSSSRVAAEQYLMNKLGLTKDQMCSLKYSLSVPNSVNGLYAGQELGFSFCPGAVTLP